MINTELDPCGSLLSRTVNLLQEHKQFDLLARETKLSIYWLQKLSTGSIKDPSVNKVQKLYEYLTRKPLTLDHHG